MSTLRKSDASNTLSGNAGDGLWVGQANVVIKGLLAQSNAGTDLAATSGSFVEFTEDQQTGPSNLADSLADPASDVWCTPGSHINFSSVSLTQSLLPAYNALPGCIYDLTP